MEEGKHLATIKRILDGETSKGDKDEDVNVGLFKSDPSLEAFYAKIGQPKQSLDVESQILNARSEVTVKYPT
jgi:hypothetical protein